jgi:transposase
LPAFATPPAAPTGQAAAFAATVEAQIVQFLGALPLLLPLFDRLSLSESVNRHVDPQGTDQDAGLVVLLLCLNRLLAPEPLVHVETWLARTALPDQLGLSADSFNDDRLARTLDRLAPHLDAIWQDLVIAAVVRFGVDLSQLCYDITSIAFTGAYEQADLVRYGYSRDHRPDRKQVELALTVTAPDGVPLDYQVLAGNIADRTTPVANLARLQALLAHLPDVDPDRPPVAPLLTSDRAMLTPESMAAYVAAEVRFLGPCDAGELGRSLLRSVPATELAAHPLAYRPQRAERDATWEPYQGVRRPLALPHPKPNQPPLALQALVVWSPGKARLDAQRRETHLTRLEAKLTDLAGKLNRRPYTQSATVRQRLDQVLRHHPARSFLTVELQAAADGTLTLVWERQAAALAEAAVLDGRYLLVTNDQHLTADDMLRLAKRRDVPEKRYETIKGPLAVRPVYVHKQDRVLGLVFCTLVALLAYALIELQCKRVAQRHSAETLFKTFARLAVVVTRFTDGSQLRQIAGQQPWHVELLRALDLPPVDHYPILRC